MFLQGYNNRLKRNNKDISAINIHHDMDTEEEQEEMLSQIQFTSISSDSFTNKKLGALKNLIIKDCSSYIAKIATYCSGVVALPYFNKEAHLEVFVETVKDHLKGSTQKLRKMVGGSFGEIRDDILEIADDAKVNQWMVKERIDWIESKKKEDFFRANTKIETARKFLTFQNKTPEDLVDSLITFQTDLLADTGATFDRIVVFLTFVLNHEELRTIILKSSYSLFIESFSKDLAQGINEGIDEYCRTDIPILIKKVISKVKDEDTKSDIITQFGPFSSIFYEKEEELLNLIIEKNGEVLKINQTCCFCYPYTMKVPAEKLAAKELNPDQMTKQEVMALTGVNYIIHRKEEKRSGERFQRSKKHKQTNIQRQLNKTNNLPNSILPQETINLIDKAFLSHVKIFDGYLVGEPLQMKTISCQKLSFYSIFDYHIFDIDIQGVKHGYCIDKESLIFGGEGGIQYFELEEKEFKSKNQFFSEETIIKFEYLKSQKKIVFCTQSKKIGLVDLANGRVATILTDYHKAEKFDHFLVAVDEKLGQMFYLSKKNKIESFSCSDFNRTNEFYFIPQDDTTYVSDLAISSMYYMIYILSECGKIFVYRIGTPACQNTFYLDEYGLNKVGNSSISRMSYTSLAITDNQEYLIVTSYQLQLKEKISKNSIFLISVKGSKLMRLNALEDPLDCFMNQVPAIYSFVNAEKYLDKEKKYPMVFLGSKNSNYFSTKFIDDGKLMTCTEPVFIETKNDPFVCMQHRVGMTVLMFTRDGKVVMTTKKY